MGKALFLYMAGFVQEAKGKGDSERHETRYYGCLISPLDIFTYAGSFSFKAVDGIECAKRKSHLDGGKSQIFHELNGAQIERLIRSK
jgi:hypothetical protein